MKSKTKGESNINEQKWVLRNYHFSIRHEKTNQILLLIYLISLLEVIYKEGDLILSYYIKTEQVDLLLEKRTGFIIFVPIFPFLFYIKIYINIIYFLLY